MDMFEQKSEEQKGKEAPLAARLRPASFHEFVGQEHIIGRALNCFLGCRIVYYLANRARE